MDDVLILAPTRWKLRRTVKMLNETLTALKLEKHPDKTFIGPIKKGFDFLGYQFQTEGLHPCIRTRLNYRVRIARLYEQGAQKTRIEQYRRRWRAWVKAGLDDRVSPSPRLSGVDFLLNHGSALDRCRVN